MAQAKIVSGSQKQTMEFRPTLHYTRILGTTKPTRVTRGIVEGFSMPLYIADEELYFDLHVPSRYDGASDIMVHVHGYLDTANTNKDFQLQLEWEHATFPIDAIPDTDNNVAVDTATGTASQYQTFSIVFTVDYDIDGGDTVTSADCLYFRLRRIATGGDEIAGEFVVCHIGVEFQVDKVGDNI